MGSAANMVRSLVVIGVLVAAYVAIVARSDRLPTPAVDAGALAGHRETLAALRATARRRLVSRLDRERAELTALHRHGRSLSPSTVLDRGFALVQHGDGRLVLGPDEVGVDELLRIRVARGIIAARALAPGTAGSAGLDR